MTIKQTLRLALFLCAAGALSLAAQNGQGAPNPATFAQHRVQFLTTVLSLTTQQQQQALTIFTTANTSETAVHDSMKMAHQSLRAAVQKNDATAIDQAAATIGNLTAEITATHAKADAALYAILTPEQQAKFNQLESHGPHMFHGGPGGMHGGHPPAEN